MILFDADPTATSLVQRARLYASQDSRAVADLFPKDVVISLLNDEYTSLWTKAKAKNAGWGRATAYEDAVVDQAAYALPAAFDVALLEVWYEAQGKDIELDTTAQPTLLTLKSPNVARTGWRLGEFKQSEFYVFEGRTTGSTFEIYAPPSVAGTQSIQFTYEEQPAVLAADGDIPRIPESHQPLLAMRAAFALRTIYDYETVGLSAIIQDRFPDFADDIADVVDDPDQSMVVMGTSRHRSQGSPFMAGRTQRINQRFGFNREN